MAVRVLNIVCYLVSFWLFSPAIRNVWLTRWLTSWLVNWQERRVYVFHLCVLLKLYLFFVLFISVDVLLRIRWFLMWNNYSWYVDSLHSFDDVLPHVVIAVRRALLLPGCCAHIFSVNWVDSCWSEEKKTK